MASRKSYHYSQLRKPTNIRLIWLEPGHPTDAIHLSIFEALSASPFPPAATQLEKPFAILAAGSAPQFWDYHALSYVWGDATNKLPITVDGLHFLITRNLCDFLVQERVPTKRVGPYWVDALCINQADNEEKAAQVNMMGDIYQNCWQCIVWLGKEERDDGVKEAFQFMRFVEGWTRHLHAGGDARTMPEAWLGKGSTEVDKQRREEIHTVILAGGELAEKLVEYTMWFPATLEPADFKDEPYGGLMKVLPSLWSAFFQLCMKPYFKRVWTIQEFVIPKNVFVLCGKESCDTTTLDIVSLVLNEHIKRKGGPPGYDRAISEGYLAMLMLCNQRHEHQTGTLRRRGIMMAALDPATASDPPLESMLLLASVIINRGRAATDPRDKLYGLIGLGNTDGLFKADYGMTVAQVYHLFALREVQSGMMHYLLQYVDMPRRLAGLPSWVPDWSSFGGLGEPFNLDSYKGAGPDIDCHRRMQRVAHPYNLYLDGCLIDTVKYVRPISFRMEGVDNAVNIFSSGLINPNDPLIKAMRLKPYHQDPEDILLRTSSGDTLMILGKQNRADANRTIMSHAPTRESETGVGIPRQYLIGRSFIFTSSGYVGLAPETTRPGDFVCIMRTMVMPFILRGKDKQGRKLLRFLDALPGSARHRALPRALIGKGASFQMIGPAYVHGVMDGELAAEVERRERVMQEFEIR